jgi:hypothetical protein
VQRPRRRDRRARKSDRIDALAAAKSVLTEERVSAPRRRGVLTAIRALLIARRSAVAERTRVLNQLQALNATAPTSLRERIGDGTGKQLERRILSMRARPNADIEERVAFAVMRDLAAHSRTLGADAKRYQHQLADLVSTLDDTLLDEAGIGPISAAKLLACDPSRFKNEAAFARCNGTAPIPASSGKPSATDSTPAATAKRTTPSTPSRSSAPNTNPKPAPTAVKGLDLPTVRCQTAGGLTAAQADGKGPRRAERLRSLHLRRDRDWLQS